MNKWTYTTKELAVADSGEFTTVTLFTNGRDTLETNSEEIDDIDANLFCDLLDKMPDLWSHNLDKAEFELNQMRKNPNSNSPLVDNFGTPPQGDDVDDYDSFTNEHHM